MSIPLVQEATKDAINTSIIAIKRNIERINMLLGLVDSGSPDLSGLATKQELEDAVNSLQPVDEVTLNNMQSVTSNAVAKAGSYSTQEHFTGRYWIDGKKIYESTFQITANVNAGTITQLHLDVDTPIKLDGQILRYDGHRIWYNLNQYESAQYYTATKYQRNIDNSEYFVMGAYFADAIGSTTTAYVDFFYTKTTD